MDLSYGEQLKMKKKQLDELLKGIARVETVIGMEEPFHYRNKVHAVFERDRRGNIISGIYQENSHIVVPVETCLIEDEKADEIIGTIRSMLKSFKIRTYDEDTGYGLLRHVLVRRGFQSGDIMVVLVTASPVFPSKNNFVRALRQKHPEITTIIQNINGRGKYSLWKRLYYRSALRMYLPHFLTVILSGECGTDGETLFKGIRTGRTYWPGNGVGCLLRDRNYWHHSQPPCRSGHRSGTE